jgi:hypothetical protein
MFSPRSCYQRFEARLCFHFQDKNQWKQQVPLKYNQPHFRLKGSQSEMNITHDAFGLVLKLKFPVSYTESGVMYIILNKSG